MITRAVHCGFFCPRWACAPDNYMSDRARNSCWLSGWMACQAGPDGLVLWSRRAGPMVPTGWSCGPDVLVLPRPPSRVRPVGLPASLRPGHCRRGYPPSFLLISPPEFRRSSDLSQIDVRGKWIFKQTDVRVTLGDIFSERDAMPLYILHFVYLLSTHSSFDGAVCVPPPY